MATPRSKIIDYSVTLHYEITCSCVRHAFLCGYDKRTNRDYSFRRQDIEDRIAHLSHFFCIDILSYSIMSNHYHMSVRANPDLANTMDVETLKARYFSVYVGNFEQKQWLSGAMSPERAEAMDEQWIPIMRERLGSISELMSRLNQQVAMQANKEDGTLGKFWQARFDAKALLDEQAILAAMVYNDSNPVRAKMASCIEDSDHSSGQQRFNALQKLSAETAKSRRTKPFETPNQAKSTTKSVPVKLVDLDQDIGPQPIYISSPEYLELLDWTLRQHREGKRGVTPSTTPPILQRLQIEPKGWCKHLDRIERHHSHWIGKAKTLRCLAKAQSKRMIKGQATPTAIS